MKGILTVENKKANDMIKCEIYLDAFTYFSNSSKNASKWQ